MRNEVAHLGGDWDSDTINEVIICAMEYMIWAIYCYEKPLEKVL